MIGLRKAAYLAVFLTFARKTYGKLTFDAGKPGKLKEYVVTVPFPDMLIIMGSFDELAEALTFSETIPCYMATAGKRNSLYDNGLKVVSIFDRDSTSFLNGDERYSLMRDYAIDYGQTRASTTM